MPRTQTIKPRETRISMRVDPMRKAVIARAAQIQHTTISDFVLENAYQAASGIVADETSIVMNEKQFEHFCLMLDNPPPANLSKMKALLNKKTLLDD